MLQIINIDKIKGYPLIIKGFEFNVTGVSENLEHYIFTIKARLTVHAPKTILLKKKAEPQLGYYELQEYGCPRHYIWEADMLGPGALVEEFQKYLNSY